MKQTWWSRRAIGLHVVILIVVPTFAALCLWQLHRALDGNGLSWAYVFEWPFFAGYAIYMWWRFLHEPPRTGPDAPPQTEPLARISAGPPHQRRTAPTLTRPRGTPTTSTSRRWPSATSANNGGERELRPEGLRVPGPRGRSVAWVQLNGTAPGGGLEPPTSGSKGRRSAD